MNHEIYLAIEAGKYSPKTAYMATPAKPPLLRKKPYEMTPEESLLLPDVLAQHCLEVEIVAAARAAYRQEENEGIALFKQDCFEYFSMDPESELAQKLWDKAWSDGHANGLWEVYVHLEDLSEIYDLHIKAMSQTTATEGYRQ